MTADFAAIAQQTVVDGRALIESLMTDTCTITRIDPDAPAPVLDPGTMQYPDPPLITVYTGKCRVQIKGAAAASSDSNAGDRLATVQELELQLPIVGTEEVAIGDVAEILTSALDSSLEERKFTVVARHEKSQATARRLRVKEATA